MHYREFPQAISHCRDGQQRRFAFQLVRNCGLYEGFLVRAIPLLKYERIEPLGAWFAERLTEVVRKSKRMEADVVVPVPLHRQRARERGFHQVDGRVWPTLGTAPSLALSPAVANEVPSQT